MRITAASTAQAVLPGVINGGAILVRWRFTVEDLQRQQQRGDLIAGKRMQHTGFAVRMGWHRYLTHGVHQVEERWPAGFNRELWAMQFVRLDNLRMRPVVQDMP